MYIDLMNRVMLDVPLRLSLLIHIAKGMQYLHSFPSKIIHRDLKSLNVLVTEDWIAKVTDFGLSRFTAMSGSEQMTGQAGTYQWMAVEVIKGQSYTEKVDVFSFGVIMWEVLTGEVPYLGMQPIQIVSAVVTENQRPPIPSSMPHDQASLIRSCWDLNPRIRPSFDDILSRLEAMI